MEELSPKQKGRLHEVVDLMLEIYQTLAKMRFIDPEGIQKGPHDIEHLLSVYKEHGLDSSIMYLYSILPYIDPAIAGNPDFFHGGEFTDFRDPDQVEQGRDPFYGSPDEDDFEDENGPYMRPWVTPLSQLGNHGSVIIYDAKKHQIWIIDQEGWSSTDPALSEVPSGKPKNTNRNNFDHIPSRPAADVLRDINHWYLTLEEMPGGGEHSGGEWNNMEVDLKALYRAHGWPNNFDGDAFEVAQIRAHTALQAEYRAEEPLRKVEMFKDWVEHADRNIKFQQDALAAAKTKDEEWAARFDLWKAERAKVRNEEDLKKAEKEAEILCPGGSCFRKEGLLLWELELLGHEYKWKQEAAQASQNWAEELKESDPERARDYLIELRHEEKSVAIYRKAYEAAKADAEKQFPGKTFQSVTGIKSLGRKDTVTTIQSQKDAIASLQQEIDAIKEWASQLPEEAEKAREMVKSDVKQHEEAIENTRDMQRKAEDWLAEHGNAEY